MQEQHPILACDLFDLANLMLDGTSVQPARPDDFGPYRFLEEKRPLGRGTFGDVWLAEEATAGRLVAIKLLRRTSEPDVWLRREIRRLGALEHQFIARLYNYGVLADGTPWLAMEHVEGMPLDEYCREKSCSLNDRLALFRAVCQGVKHAHAAGIIHGDLKPSNILVKESGEPKLLDFGLAEQFQSPEDEITQSPSALGFTPAYAAPEQFRHAPVSIYIDVYALGVILYELLTGELPFDGSEHTAGEMSSIAKGEWKPRPPSASSGLHLANRRDLDALCLKAMERDPGRRYSSVETVIQDLDRYATHRPLEARAPHTWSYRAGRFVHRNRRAVVIASMTSALLVTLVLWFTLRLRIERDQANRANEIATAMNRFLSDDILGRSDPFKSGKAGESLADVVNAASPQVDVQFSSQTSTAARLHQTMAKAFDSRSEFRPARREYKRASELFQQSGGPISADAVVVDLQRASMEARSQETGSLQLAKAILRDAEKQISGMTRPGDALQVWQLSARGTIALVENDVRTAQESFSAALSKAQATSSFDAAAQTQLRRMLAFCSIRMGDSAKAEPLLRQVVSALSRMDGPDSGRSLQARVNLCQALLGEHKYSEAVTEANALYPALVRRLGEDHEVTLSILAARAAAEGSLGMWNEAIRDDLTVYNLAVRKQGPASFFAIAMLSDAAMSQCSAERYVEGELNARKAYEQSSRTFGVRAPLTQASSFALATCLIGMNKLQEASGLLLTIDTKAVAQLSGDPTISASVTLAQGEIAAKKGDYALAKRCADAAAAVFDLPGAQPPNRLSLQKLRAAINSHSSPSK